MAEYVWQHDLLGERNRLRLMSPSVCECRVWDSKRETMTASKPAVKLRRFGPLPDVAFTGRTSPNRWPSGRWSRFEL